MADNLTTRQRMLLTAIDIPLTEQTLRGAQLDPEALVKAIDSPNESLYLRGRAIAAIAILGPQGLSSLLENICVGPYPTALKQQAVISLARAPHVEFESPRIERLLSLLSRTQGVIIHTLIKEIERLEP